MTDHIVFLQNAWSPVYAGLTWPRASWLRALKNSRSGQRLRLLLDDFEICENTTPQVGCHSSSVFPPDLDHIRRILKRREPRVVVACGKQAEEALLELWDKALLIVPHPAYRVLTDSLYEHARICIERLDAKTRMKLTQGRNRVISQIL